MHLKTQKAFTMVELIFVIIIIGILSAVAIPKFSQTSIIAHDAKATSVLTSVMSSLATYRQKLILRGETKNITSLGTGTDAFSVFSVGGTVTLAEVLSRAVANCTNGEKGCWSRSNSAGIEKYEYKFVDSGIAKFKLDNNRLVCADSNTTNCARLLK